MVPIAYNLVMTDNKVQRAIHEAMRGSQQTDDGHWKLARAANWVVGKYEKGATREMAEAVGRSISTVEDHAHAWLLYVDFCLMGDLHRETVFNARKLPFVHYSHFKTLYDLKEKHNLTLEQTWGYFLDVLYAEGDITVRALEFMVEEKHGDEVTWQWYLGKAQKHLQNALNDPTLPKDGRDALKSAYNWIGDNA